MPQGCAVIMNGGLGNQMFEIAAAYSHCQRNGYTLKVTGSPRSHGGPYWETYLHKIRPYLGDPDRFGGPLIMNITWRERGFRYAPIPRNTRIMMGYFQSSKHFAGYEDEIRALFDPTEEIKARVRLNYAALIADMDGRVAVHIRRGDYLSTPTFHGILGPDYYARAIAALKQRRPEARLVVFSDDIAWCRTQPYLVANSTVFIDERSDCDALYLMTHFRNFVMSNSTFSWWGSWLSIQTDKLVIAPDRWFGSTGPKDYQDVYEPWWTTVPV